MTAKAATSRRRSNSAPLTSDSAVVSVTLPNPPPVTSAIRVSVSPTAASLQTGAQQQFTALVSGTNNTAVTWSVSAGTIAANGVYTAPGTAGTYTITAMSSADGTKSASALVIVSVPQPVAVTISPANASVGETTSCSSQPRFRACPTPPLRGPSHGEVERSPNLVCIPLRGPPKTMSSQPPVRSTPPSQPAPRLPFLARTQLR